MQFRVPPFITAKGEKAFGLGPQPSIFGGTTLGPISEGQMLDSWIWSYEVTVWVGLRIDVMLVSKRAPFPIRPCRGRPACSMMSWFWRLQTFSVMLMGW